MIVSTKLHIPHVRNVLVYRPRLMQKLNEGMDAKLTLVSAQAGYGKTTALSEWVKQCNALVAWVSLDKQDNDWIQFWKYVIASIQEKDPGFGSTVGLLLEKGPSMSTEPAIIALLNELSLLSGELVIILDDYHVIELSSINHSMTYLLEHLPSHIHMYIASRTDLIIPTTRLLAKGEFHRIIMDDLRFKLDEGLVFFRDTTDLLLTKEQVTELFHQTEGWISGLQLAAISLKRSENIDATIQQFKGQQQHISDYLLEEVFHHQSESIRAFLMETSILGRMNHSLCEAVTGHSNCQEQLEQLVQLNLFVIPLDDQRNWYRYHHLLSDFLQQILFRTNLEKWIQVHIAAANWLEHHGFDEEAVEHYLEGKQIENAVRLIEKNLHKLVHSKNDLLMKWVSLLPENAFAEKPMIDLLYISVLLGVGEWQAAFSRIEKVKIRFQMLQGKMNDGEWHKVMGNIYFFCSISSYLQKDLEQMSANLEWVERLVPEGSFYQTMGRNRYQAYDIFDDYLAHINDLHGAETFLMKWITVWGDKKEYPFIGFLYASYSKLMYEWNRLDEAEYYAFKALGRKDIEPYARITIPNYIGASRIQQAKGNPNRASELLARLTLQIDSPDYELFMLGIEAEQACLSLQQGSLQAALDWMRRCGLAHTDEISLIRMAEYLSLARVLAACARIEEALYLLEQMYRILEKEDRLRDQIKVLIMQSVMLRRLGRTEAAGIQFEAALHLAEPEGYIRSFVDEGPEVAELLTVFLKAQKSNLSKNNSVVSTGYMKQLLQAFSVLPRGSVKEILTEQETKVLRLIAEGLSNKEMAHRLNITGETVKFHIKNMYRKFGVNNRVQALQHANELMILI
ncbi:LuxR family maltose regulon positive regulatory protein [Paenibacillus castaneae]|uniref:LuxR C-terminal-related transcriptional regulator n=1 Tax=Paenibacillus castaneae TaxID=474957 RepID=UPI000C9A2C92|nr:LuxR C-terminal-related transcriptional regulator [Paenibacillus castaneae]NIK78514.1 LuxR family maltose regulon positive regulatory protein [Paenibacillus castaneae]